MDQPTDADTEQSGPAVDAGDCPQKNESQQATDKERSQLVARLRERFLIGD